MIFEWATGAWNWFKSHLHLYPDRAEDWHEEVINNFVEQHQLPRNNVAYIRFVYTYVM
jgi:hypothetical protein